jgi:soluble P-type ATPase
MFSRRWPIVPFDVSRIEDLKRGGHKVLTVGDGLKDAPSPAAAHLSVSPISAAHHVMVRIALLDECELWVQGFG